MSLKNKKLNNNNESDTNHQELKEETIPHKEDEETISHKKVVLQKKKKEKQTILLWLFPNNTKFHLFCMLSIIFFCIYYGFYPKNQQFSNLFTSFQLNPSSSDDTRFLLPPSKELLIPHPFFNDIDGPVCNHIPHLMQNEIFPVQNAILEKQKNGNLLNKVFVMLNGENKGIYISWNSNAYESCLWQLANIAAQHLSTNELDKELPLMLYTPDGLPISKVKDIESSGRMLHLLFDQEVWVWPGIEVGHTWIVDNTIEMTTLSLVPKVIHVRNFLTKSECDETIEAGEKILLPSPSVSGDDSQFPNYRTSSSAFIHNSPISKIIQARAHLVARLPFLEYVESVQLVRYLAGQWFKEHTDYFDHYNLTEKLIHEREKHPQINFQAWVSWSRQHIAKSLSQVNPNFQKNGKWYPSLHNDFQNRLMQHVLDQKEHPLWKQVSEEWKQWIHDQIYREDDILITFLNTYQNLFPYFRNAWETLAGKNMAPLSQVKFVEPNRHATLFLYLNHVEEGGETVFPFSQVKTKTIERIGMPECSRGLTVRPSLGDGALFYSKTPDGKNDEMSYHGGCPPTKGVKYGSNVFMWNVDSSYGVSTWGF